MERWILGHREHLRSGLTNSLASFALALIAPTLGAIADRGAYRKRLLLFFTVLGALASAGLGFVGKGEWALAVTLFSIGIVGFTGALPFYDALLMQVAQTKELDRVSALGYAMGYLGGGLLFLLNVIMFLKPEIFGFADGAVAVKMSFITVGVWWLLFSIPLFLFVPEWPARSGQGLWQIVRTSAAEMITLVRELRRHRALFYFLIAFLIYNDAVNTIVKMAVDYGMAIGIGKTDLIKALLLVQFIGFPAAILFGRLAERSSPVKGIWICLVTYLGVTIYAYFLQTANEFFVIAGVIGLVQGGIQALSRSYYARLVTPEESAKYFGFFNMIGKFSSIVGPFLVGWVGVVTGNPRAGILVLAVFFVGGGLLLFKSGRDQSLVERPAHEAYTFGICTNSSCSFCLSAA